MTKKTFWSDNEKAILKLKVREGKKSGEIQVSCFPDRSKISVQKAITRFCERGKTCLDVEVLRADAIAVGLILLDDTYKIGKLKYRYRCMNEDCGFPWSYNLQNIRRKKTRCVRCYNKIVLIDDPRKIAESRGGQCLDQRKSGTQISATSPLKFKCAAGHHFEKNFNKLKSSGQWCPDCGPFISERIVRLFLETLTGHKLPNTRKLDWLCDENGQNLTLDGYCPELKLAFEHWGTFHWDDGPINRRYYKGMDFEKVWHRDFLKIFLCESENVNLVVVPQLHEVLPLNELKDYLIKALKEANIPIVQKFTEDEIDPSPAYSVTYLEFTNEMDKIIEARGAKRLDPLPPAGKIKFGVDCPVHGRFLASRDSVRKGNWCAKCGFASSAKKRMGTTNKALIGSITKINAKLESDEKGFRCISAESDYRAGSETVLKFQCIKDPTHTWSGQRSNYVNRKNALCQHCPKTEQYQNLSKLKSKPILCLNNNTVYENAILASNALGISESAVRHVLKGRNDQASGYKFEYLNSKENRKYRAIIRERKLKKEEYEKKRSADIYSSTLNRTFGSVTKAANFLGVSPSRIGDVVSGRRKTVKGHKFEFVDRTRRKKARIRSEALTKNRVAHLRELQKARRKGVLCTSTGETFSSIKDAAQVKKLNASHISSVCRGERASTGGLNFKFLKQS